MAAEDGPLLKPNVLWAQREEMVLLRVKMEPLKKPEFKIHETHLDYKGLGVGASGKNWYGFQIVFCGAVDTNQCRVRFLEHEVEFRLKKAEAGAWPRLQSDNRKPHWIKTDFDHFEVSESEEEQDTDMMTPAMKATQEQIMEGIDQYNAMVDIGEKIKTSYVVLYNVIQSIGFSILTGVLLYLLKDGQAGIGKAYEFGFPVISIFQMLAVLEIVNNLLGFVKGGVVPSMMQVLGRLFVLFVCLAPVESIHTHPVVYCLFLVYSIIEIVSVGTIMYCGTLLFQPHLGPTKMAGSQGYPFYLMSALKMNIWWLSWLRYSMWIPLYPLGFACEGITIWLSLQNGPPGGVWSYPLPNPLNIAFSVSGLQKFMLATGPIYFFVLYSHMAAQRRKKLSSSKEKKD